MFRQQGGKRGAAMPLFFLLLPASSAAAPDPPHIYLYISDNISYEVKGCVIISLYFFLLITTLIRPTRLGYNGTEMERERGGSRSGGYSSRWMEMGEKNDAAT